jgi:hypothetical protein
MIFIAKLGNKLLCLIMSFRRVQLFSDDISVFSLSRLFSPWRRVSIWRGPPSFCCRLFFLYSLSLTLTLSSLCVAGSACLSQLTRDGERVLHEDDRKKLLGIYHKVLIFTEYHSVCPLARIGTPPTPLPLASVPPPPPNQRVGGGTLACGWWVGGIPMPTTEKA